MLSGRDYSSTATSAVPLPSQGKAKGRMIWGESGKPGYGLLDRALGATYINGLFEALEKELI